MCVTCNIEIIILHSLLLPITEEVRERDIRVRRETCMNDIRL